MNSLEMSPLTLEKVEILEKDRHIYIAKDGQKDAFVFPKKMLPIFLGLQQNNSLKDLILWLRKNEVRFTVKGLVNLIESLSRMGLIKGGGELLRRLYLLDAGPGWPLPAMKFSVGSFQVIKEKTGKKWGVTLPLILLLLMVGLNLWQGMGFFSVKALSFGVPRWTTLLYFYCISSVALSLKNIIKLLFVRSQGGAVPNSFVRITPIGIFLDIEDKYFFDGRNEVFFAPYIFLTALLYPVFYLLALSALPVVEGQYALLLLWLAFLIEVSPFSHSDLTLFLQISFSSEKSLVSKAIQQKIVKVFHKIFIVLWLLALGFIVYLNRHIFTGEIALFLKVFYVIFAGTFFWELLSGIGFLRNNWLQDSLMGTKKRAGLLAPERFSSNEHINSVIEKVGLFKDFPKDVLDSLLSTAEIIECKAGEKVCGQGETDRSLFVVLTGTLGVIKPRSLNRGLGIPLVSGAILGEVSFFTGAARTADVAAIEDSRLLKISQNSDTKIDINDEKFKKIKDRIWLQQALSTSSLLKDLPIEVMEWVISSGETRVVPADVSLTAQGDTGKEFFFVIDGYLKVMVYGKTIKTLRRGDFFGEIALLMNAQRTATVKTAKETKVLCIEEKPFWNLLASHVALAQMVESTAFARIR